MVSSPLSPVFQTRSEGSDAAASKRVLCTLFGAVELEKTKGLKALSLSLSWVPYRFIERPSNENAAAVINPPFPSNADAASFNRVEIGPNSLNPLAPFNNLVDFDQQSF